MNIFKEIEKAGLYIDKKKTVILCMLANLILLMTAIHHSQERYMRLIYLDIAEERKEVLKMPLPKDRTMLAVNSVKFNIALANAELDPKTLADKAGVTKNIVYTARRGCYVKPIYLGKIAKALGVDVESLINIPFSTYDE